MLWNKRTIGNNVLKLEYEVYGTGNFIAETWLVDEPHCFMSLGFNSATSYQIEALFAGVGNQILNSYNISTFPYNIWHKVELFYDYNTKKGYYYIPNLNLFKVVDISNFAFINYEFITHNIILRASNLNSGSMVKYDNIKLSALPSVPPYILSANEIVSAKFNMYPNPATNVVNITNSENMLVEQVTVYDISGKQLTTQNYNNETLVQLNIENLASGTYMLHIQTNAGLAVKKLVKK